MSVEKPSLPVTHCPLTLVRLAKRIAQSGKYSRREADRLLATGRVTVRGAAAVTGQKVSAEETDIRVDGTPIGEADGAIYKFHKPRGVLSSYFDPNNKNNLSAFKELAGKRLGYSGRLDFESEGLMLFSADGALIHKIQAKEQEVEKEYLVHTDKDLNKSQIKRLEGGITLGNERFLPCVVERRESLKYKVVLVEGKKRQIRRMFKSMGVSVTRLIRLRIGGISLGDLEPGAFEKAERGAL